ncbi:MAG: hypothetical protein LBC80_01090 [Treponema sp.]|jgi:hypothetical protein|nr:hypothetical protein [Treponema sp.]
MNKNKISGGRSMTNQDRQLIVETLGEIRELKGEMKEFKQNVIERVQRLEKKEGERRKDRNSLFSVIIAFTALLVSIIVNFIKHGGNH